MKRMIVGLALLAAGCALVGCVYDRKWTTITSMGVPYDTEPKNAEVLYEDGDTALYAGETAEDVAHNAKDRWNYHRSLFLHRRTKSGANEWRLVLTSGSDWKEPEGLDKFGKFWACEPKDNFDVLGASLSRDGRYIWLVSNAHNSVFSLVCRFDMRENTLAVMSDGSSAEEQPDGTILVTGRKTYLSDENGEPLGAAWFDAWITPEGKVLRKGRPVTMAEMQAEDAAEREKKEATK